MSDINEKDESGRLISISKKTFFSVIITLMLLVIAAAICTYVIPGGHFGVGSDGELDFSQYIRDDSVGIPVWKAILSPIFVLLSSDGISVIMLSLFLAIVSGAFQIMSDTDGIKALVAKLISLFRGRDKLLISLLVLVFMLFGSLLGLFEETLALLPVIIMLCLGMGYDSFTGFLVCTVATAFGFSAALTNPFTVLLCSNIIGADLVRGMWYRLLIFIVMYAVLLCCIFIHIKRIKKDPALSPSYTEDEKKRRTAVPAEQADGIAYPSRLVRTYTVFFIVIITAIIVSTVIDALRDYTIVVMILTFLLGGIICGYVAGAEKTVWRSFARGMCSALPALAMIMMAAAVKYVLTEGNVLHTIVYQIGKLTAGLQPVWAVCAVFAVIVFLEFFISSSTAKAVLVMGILGMLVQAGTISVSRETLVLTYLFSDGYTNVLFPTSPVLIIGLSMAGVGYGKWLKKSALLFTVVLLLAFAFLALAVGIGY